MRAMSISGRGDDDDVILSAGTWPLLLNLLFPSQHSDVVY